jgi:hypothetical protein
MTARKRQCSGKTLPLVVCLTRQEKRGTAFAIERSEQNLSQFDDVTFF